MKFEARELPKWVECVPVSELRDGEVYFIVSFVDDEMRVPELRPVVFAGRNLEPSESGKLYVPSGNLLGTVVATDAA